MRALAAFALAGLLASRSFGSDLFNDAVAAFERGDFPSAESTLHALLRSHPNDASGLGLLGAVLDSEKKFPDAESTYRQALKLTPNSATLLNNYANHQLATGDRRDARATYLKVLALNPKHPNANLQIASLAIQNKNSAEALNHLGQIQPDIDAPQVAILRVQALFLAGQNAQAATLLEQLSTAAASDPRLGFTLGLALAAVAHYRESEATFSNVLEKVGTSFDVLYNLGLAAHHAGHLERARQVFQQALTQRPDDVDTVYNLASVEIDRKQQQSALALLSKAARIDPGRASVQLAVAQTASALGYYADSRLAYERYTKLAPTDVAARREYIFTMALSENPREGLDQLKAFAGQHPKDPIVHYEVALLEAKTDPSDALLQLNGALSLEPDFAPARLGRGAVNLLKGDTAAALPDLEYAAARYPENSTVLDRLGEAYTALDRPSDAVRVLRKASEIAPGDARVLMHFSRALAKSGASEEARTTLARFRAVGSKPGNLIPMPGIVDLLSLSPEEQQTRYREEVRRRLTENPQDAGLNVRYIQILVAEGKAEELSSAAQRLLSLKPLAPQAAEAGHSLLLAARDADAKPLLEYAFAADRDPATQIDLAAIAFHEAGPAAGLEQIDRVPAKRGVDFFLTRAQILHGAGKTEEALADLAHASQLSSSRPDLAAQIDSLTARLDLEKRDYSAALNHLQQVVRLRPDDLDAHETLSEVYSALGRSEDASHEREESERLRTIFAR